MADKKIDLSHFDEAVKKYDLSGFDQPTLPEASQDPGMLKSALLGGAQSATLGFADEGEAGVRSVLPEAIGGGNYEDLIKEIRQRYKTAEDVNPGSYLAGELAGGLATVAIPGLGLAGEAKGLAQAGNMLKTGAIAGGLSSLGGREDSKLSVQAAEDAAKSAAIGGGLGVALGTAVPAIAKGIGKGISKSQLGEDVAEVYNKIKSGEVATFKKEALPGFKSEMEKAAQTDILGNLNKVKDFENSTYENIRNMAKASEADIPTSDLVNELRMKMPTEQQGVTPQDLSVIDKNLAGLIGEKEVAREVAVPIDSEAAKQKVYNSLQGKAAAGEVKAEREYARQYLQGKLKNELSSQLTGKELDSAVSKASKGFTSADIDDAVEEVRKLGLRERTQFPPEFEVNPETGLEVGLVKRADADLTQAVPDSKLQKVTEKVATKENASPQEMMDRIDNLKGLLTDKMKDENPALFKYITDAKNTLEKKLTESLPKEYSQAKELADTTYRKVLVEGPARHLDIPKNLGTSYEGQSNLGNTERSLTGKIANFWDKSTDQSGQIQKFLNSLKEGNAEEIGLISSGKQGPATISDIEKNLQNVSKNYNLAERASGVSALQGATPNLTTPAGIVKRVTNFGMSSAVGKTLGAAETAGNMAKEIGKISEFMHSNTPDSVMALANKITDNKLATILKNAATAPDAKRKAVIFSLMQQPAYRDAINSANEEP